MNGFEEERLTLAVRMLQAGLSVDSVSWVLELPRIDLTALPVGLQRLEGERPENSIRDQLLHFIVDKSIVLTGDEFVKYLRRVQND